MGHRNTTAGIQALYSYVVGNIQEEHLAGGQGTSIRGGAGRRGVNGSGLGGAILGERQLGLEKPGVGARFGTLASACGEVVHRSTRNHRGCR